MYADLQETEEAEAVLNLKHPTNAAMVALFSPWLGNRAELLGQTP